MDESMTLIRSARFFLPLYVVLCALSAMWVFVGSGAGGAVLLGAAVAGAAVGAVLAWSWSLTATITVDSVGIHFRNLFRRSTVRWGEIAALRGEVRLRAGGEVPDFRIAIRLRLPDRVSSDDFEIRMSVRGVRRQTAVQASQRLQSAAEQVKYSSEWTTLRPWSEQPPTPRP